MIYKFMFDSMGSTSYQYKASPEFMEMDWKLYPGNRRPPSKTTGKQKIRISPDMARGPEGLNNCTHGESTYERIASA